MKIAYALILVLLCGCSAQYVPEIKDHAPASLRANGFEVVGYQGYSYGSFGQWGGCVWYTMRRIPDNGVTYEGCVAKWGDEYHIYNLRAIDAIKPGAE